MKFITLAAVVLIGVMSASADMVYQFYNVTSNSLTNAATGEQQLSLTVSQGSSASEILFSFNNSGPKASSICDIYFDDAAPFDLTYNKFIEGPGVDFTVGASPKNLPGWKPITFSSDYSYDSDNPTQPKGVNPGEFLGIVFNYTNGANYDGIINNLNNGSLNVGLHVQGFANGGSESFVTHKVPEPASLAFLLTGLLGVGSVSFLRRKKK